MPATLDSARSTTFPPGMAKTPSGRVLVTTGLDRMQAWDGFDDASRNAGITAPAAAPSVSLDSGGAATAGDYQLAFRYVAADGRVSDMSPSATLTATANQRFDWDTVPDSSDTQVTGKQLLRTTAGQATTYYIITTLANGVTSYTSDTSSDAGLAATGTAVPLFNPDGSLSANRHGVPPGHKLAIAHYRSRMWFYADAVYMVGSVKVTNGSPTVTGVGTAFTSLMAGWKLYVNGEDEEYTVSSVGSATSLTLSGNYSGTTDNFALYVLRPAADERNKLYYSEEDLPESVPSSNALITEEDGDDPTGLIGLYDRLFLLKRESMYGLYFKVDPTFDAHVSRVANRGCVNNRCAVRVDGTGFMLDRRGVWAFDGSGVQDVSRSIQDVFERQISWQQADWFHAVADTYQGLVYFFVCLDGSKYPRHALVLDYRHGLWHTEEFPDGIAASTAILVNGHQRVILGGEHGRLWIPQPGLSLDGRPYGTTRAEPTSTTLLSVTDTAASHGTVAGYPIGIAAGSGRQQVRRIVASASGRLTTKTPWTVLPSTASTYQIGGIAAKAKFGRYRFAASDMTNKRQVWLRYEPTSTANSLDVRFYSDHDTEPVAHTGLDLEAGLVTADRDGVDVKVDLARVRTHPIDGPADGTGEAVIPMDGHAGRRGPASRSQTVEIKAIQGETPIVLCELEIEGVTAR